MTYIYYVYVGLVGHEAHSLQFHAAMAATFVPIIRVCWCGVVTVRSSLAFWLRLHSMFGH